MSTFSKDQILERINRVSRENGHGDMSSAIFNAWYGINHRGTGSPVPTNADQHGLTFFTRPNLNLSYDNIKTERIFLPLLDKRGTHSIFRAIRLLLDREAFDEERNIVPSSLVDNTNPFISILTNNLLSMSGWQDVVLDTYTSKEGRAREAWSMGDGKTRNFSVTGMSASFRNMIGDPITLLFFYWVNYISLVYEGRITPKPDSIIENEIDYMTRIYRIVLDPTRTYVRKMSACGVAFPTSAPIGASHNFSVDSPYNMENKDISINFQVIGADYLDPILVDEFNKLVDIYTGGLKTDNKDISLNFNDNNPARKGKYIKLGERDSSGKLVRDNNDLALLNHRGIPRIDPITYELEWYVEQSIYQQELNVGASVLDMKVVPNEPSAATTVKTAFTDAFDVTTGYITGSNQLKDLEGEFAFIKDTQNSTIATRGSEPVVNQSVAGGNVDVTGRV